MTVPLHWHTEPLLLLTVVGASWVYALATGPWRAVCAPTLTGFPFWRAVRFHLGVAAAYLAVGSPLDQLGESFLFWAHMLQHMLLIYVAAPLVVSGLPPEMTDPFLSRRPRLQAVLRPLVHPVAAGVLFTLVFSIWHFPEFYEAALSDKPLHVLEHWSIFLTAVLMVWPLVSPSAVLPRIGHGPVMIYAFCLMVGDLPLWGALIFGEHPVYETYRLAPRVSDLTAMDDLVLGAAVMKGFNELFSLGFMTWAFFSWYRRDR
ncbi:MAG: cytochrome c oxidase assembly protein [Opitutales bacterium]